MSKRGKVIEHLHVEVDAARDAFYSATGSAADLVDRLAAWQELADRLFIFETKEGMQPIYRGPQPRWIRPASR
jgi:hypothetical protein